MEATIADLPVDRLDAESAATTVRMNQNEFLDPQGLLAAPMATLTRRAETVEAHIFVDAAAKLLETHEIRKGIRQRKRTEAAQAGFLRAVEAFLGSLLLGAKIGRGGWVYRSRQAKSFSGGEVAYRQFTAVVEAMEALGLIEVVDGFNAMKTVSWDGGQTSRYQQGKAARFKATENLLGLASDAGVEIKEAGKHFQETKPGIVIVLKDSSRRVGRDKIPGRPMPFSPTLEVERLEEQVRLINDFLEGVDIRGGIHKGFYRIFNLGDRLDFDWDKGGRLYSIGIDNYQPHEGYRAPQDGPRW